MPIEIIDCEQKSEEWYRARMGIPTASMFSTVLAGWKTGKESRTRDSYMRKLAGEILSDTPMESYSNDDMERGVAQEPELRARYAFLHDADIAEVGFIKNHGTGCSPDGLVGADGMLQIKSAAPHVMIEILLDGGVPAKHIPQLQGEMWVAERKWTDLVIGSAPKMPLFVQRVERDDRYIQMLSQGVAEFNTELKDMVAKIRRMA